MKTTKYRLGQPLPPQHWYQKRIGWFGQFMTGIMVLSVVGAGSVGYVMNRNTVRSFAAQTSASDRLHKVTSAIGESSVENIIDVQYVIDKWAEEHPGQKWGIVAKSISGPAFDAQINADKQYESSSIQKLLITLPLFQQIPAEQQKSIRVPVDSSSKSMQTCVDLMVRLSNDSCANTINRYVDFREAAEQLKKAGLNKTSFSGNTVKTTAQDTAKYLEILQTNSLSRTARTTVMRLLHEQHYRAGIPAACPGCKIANKANPVDKTVHDAAVISYSGGSYILVVFGNKGTVAQVNELAGKIQQKILDTTSN